MSELVLPKHLSYSQVTTMLKCGEQWRLERGLRVPSRPGWAMVGGSAVHAATEILDYNWGKEIDLRLLFNEQFDEAIAEELKRSEGSDSPWTKEDFRASGRASKQWPEKENEAWWRAHGPEMVGSWLQWRRMSPMEIWRDDDGEQAIELEIDIELAGLPAKVIIDRVMHAQVGGPVILDIKSGANMPKDTMQLGVYAHAVEVAYGFRPRMGMFWDARNGTSTVPADLDVWPKARLDFVFGKVRARQESGDFVPVVSPMCSACPVRQYCYAVGGELAHTVPQVWQEQDSFFSTPTNSETGDQR